MRYSGTHASDQAAMLQAIGKQSIDQLLESVPDSVRSKNPLDIEGPLPEATLMRRLEALHGRAPRVSLVGGGLYSHYIPKTVDSLAARSEWVTSYTPYQAELAQGTLNMYYEFQTYVSMLTGQEIANGGMYDGSTATAEAVLMAHRIQRKRTRVLVSEAVHPEYRAVLATYMRFQDMTVEVLPLDPETGRTRLDDINEPETAIVVLQSPNFLGCIEDRSALSDDCFVVWTCTEAQSMVLVPPMEADIAVGELQSLGIPIQLGGPTAGYFATAKKHVRQLPGRLVGQSVDRNGKDALCITLATREQFIRRAKATSNICTSSGLMCLRSTIYTSLLGREGLEKVATQSARAARGFLEGMKELGLEARFPNTPFFNEFVLDLKGRPDLYEKLAANDFLLGIPLGEHYPSLEGCVLVALTELHYPEVQALIEEVKTHANG